MGKQMILWADKVGRAGFPWKLTVSKARDKDEIIFSSRRGIEFALDKSKAVDFFKSLLKEGSGGSLEGYHNSVYSEDGKRRMVFTAATYGTDVEVDVYCDKGFTMWLSYRQLMKLSKFIVNW